MIENDHALISVFLQQQTVRSLVTAEAGDAYTKAGVVPFLRGAPYRFYMMKPIAKIPELGAPPFQLCKGTRMQNTQAGWRDMKEGGPRETEKETLVQTALREGIEELGLKLDNIAQLLDLGPYGFASATTGKSKAMWLFAAEIKNENDFGQAAQSTAERGWLTSAEFKAQGRDDHWPIVKDIEAKLAVFYND